MLKKRLLTILVTGTVLTLGALTPSVQAENFDAQIDSANSQIESITSEKQGVSQELDALYNQIVSVQTRVGETQNKQRVAKEELAKLQTEIAQLEKLIAEREARLQDQARAVQVNNNGSYVDYVLSSESVTDAINRLVVITDIITSSNQLLEDQVADKVAVEEKEQAQQEVVAEQGRLAYELESLKDELDQTYANNSSLLASLSEAEITAVATRDGLVAEKAAYQQELAQAAEAARKTETQQRQQVAIAAAQQEAAQQAEVPAAQSVAVAPAAVQVTSTEAAQPAAAPAPAVTSTYSEPVAASTQVATVAPAPAPVVASSSTAAAIGIAQQYLGVPYQWGGSTPAGFDCSGLVQYVYGQLGISLPRVTYAQEYVGTRISLAEAQPGDLLFWGSPGGTHHVAIYMGNNTFIHAPSEGGSVEIRNFSWWYPSFAVRL